MSDDNIKIVVRVRPFNSVQMNSECIVDMDGRLTTLKTVNGPKEFSFHRCYWSHDNSQKLITNQDIFQDLGKQILNNAYEGYNSTVFAYGQTGSGKSFSIQGYAPDKGLLQMFCQDIFMSKIPMSTSKGLKVQIAVSYLQIYNQELRDLLDPSRKGLKVISTGNSILIQNLSVNMANSYEDMIKMFNDGKKIRVIGAHALNKTSSRSHAVFIIFFKQSSATKTTSCKINIVDLAGSQRQNKTGAQGVRLQQANNINKSLTFLGVVIEALATKGAKDKFVPYRNSQLTHILSESLGGNSKTVMIAAISPSRFNQQQTLSTLRFAQRVACIKTKSKKNQINKAAEKQQLLNEIDRLKRELQIQRKKQPTVHDNYIEKVIYQENDQTITALKKELEERVKMMELSEENIKKIREEEQEKAKQQRQQIIKEIGIGHDEKLQKSLPYLINISDDPSFSGTLLYIISKKSMKLGNTQDPSTDIKVPIGLGIKINHCNFERNGMQVQIQPKPNADIFVNNKKITQKVKLKHMDKLCFGVDSNFRFIVPGMPIVESLKKQKSVIEIGVQYEQFFNRSQEGSSTLKILQKLSAFMNKNQLMKFASEVVEFMKNINNMNQLSNCHYRKFPLRQHNVKFTLNFILDGEDIKKTPSLGVVCRQKDTNQPLYIWSQQKTQQKFQQMQLWWGSGSKKNNSQRSFSQADPWFQPSEQYFAQIQKINSLKPVQLQNYYINKIKALNQKRKKLNIETGLILQNFKKKNIKQSELQLMTDVIRQIISDQKTVKKISDQLQADPELSKQVKKYMETFSESENYNLKIKQIHERLLLLEKGFNMQPQGQKETLPVPPVSAIRQQQQNKIIKRFIPLQWKA